MGKQKDLLISQINPWVSYELLPNGSNPWLQESRNKTTRIKKVEGNNLNFDYLEEISIANVEDFDIRIGNEISFEELEKIIRVKTNEQLNQYSNLFFNKAKKDIKIDEL